MNHNPAEALAKCTGARQVTARVERRNADGTLTLEAVETYPRSARRKVAMTTTAALKVGDKVQFTLGDTPMLGTILFAVGTGAAAVKLTSGTEIIIDLDSITGRTA